MRLYPPAYIIGRENLKACEIGGFYAPAGTTMLISQWVVQRDPRYFDKPDVFEPRRWLDGLARAAYPSMPISRSGAGRACASATPSP